MFPTMQRQQLSPPLPRLNWLARCKALAALLLLAGAAVPVAGQDSHRFLTLRVSDGHSQVPLSGVRVTLRGVTDRDWITDSAGHAVLAVAAGQRAELELRRIGYAPRSLSIEAGAGPLSMHATMLAAVLTLDTTRVLGEAGSAMLSGFEGRRLRGAGSATFITREQIERQLSLRTIDVVRRAAGARVVDSSGVLLVASSRGAKTIIGGAAPGKALAKANDLAPCIMRVAVDGMMREWGFSLDDISPKDIHGVEIYPGPATMPAEFSGLRKDAYCGLVMIWTRRGP